MIATVAACHAFRAPVLSRGGGTSLCFDVSPVYSPWMSKQRIARKVKSRS